MSFIWSYCDGRLKEVDILRNAIIYSLSLYIYIALFPLSLCLSFSLSNDLKYGEFVMHFKSHKVLLAVIEINAYIFRVIHSTELLAPLPGFCGLLCYLTVVYQP